MWRQTASGVKFKVKSVKQDICKCKKSEDVIAPRYTTLLVKQPLCWNSRMETYLEANLLLTISLLIGTSKFSIGTVSISHLTLAETKLIPKGRTNTWQKTSGWNVFLHKYCETNNIIKAEEAVLKEGVWGCTKRRYTKLWSWGLESKGGT